MKTLTRNILVFVLIFAFTVLLVSCDFKGLADLDGNGADNSQNGGKQDGGKQDGGTQNVGNQDGGKQDGEPQKSATEGLEYTRLEDSDTYALTGYNGFSKDVTVPALYEGKAVTHLKLAFYQNTQISSVELPDSIVEIGDLAFSGCASLAEIKFGSGLKTVGASAFANCSSLTSVSFPDSLEKVNNYAFSGCSSLISVSFGSDIQWMGRYIYQGCSSVAEINIPNSTGWYFTAQRTGWAKKENGEAINLSTPEENVLIFTESDTQKYWLYRVISE